MDFLNTMKLFPQQLASLVLCGSVFLMCLVPVYAAENSSTVSLTTSNGDNFYTVGEYLTTTNDVPDDFFAAGQAIEVNNPVTGDVAAAGTTIDISADVGGDVRIAGQTLRVAANVADHLIAFGQIIILRSNASIGGDAWLGGTTIEISAPIAGDARIYANHVTISAPIAGNALIEANQITFTGEGRINGNLDLTAPQNIAPEKVGGEITFQETKSGEKAKDFKYQAQALFSGFSFFMFLASLLLGGLIIFLLQPFWRSYSETVRTRPFVNFAVGLLVLIIMPILAIICMATLVGLPVGFIILFLYIASIIFVSIMDGIALGAFFFPVTKTTDFRHLLASFVLGSILLFLLGLVPIAGAFLKFVIFILALGAFFHIKWELFGALRKTKKI